MKTNLYLLILITLTSCNKMQDYKAIPYVIEVEDKKNGLHQEQKFEEDGIRFEAQFRPAAYSALKEIGAENFSPQEWENLNVAYQKSIWFEFKIAAANNDYDVLKSDLPPDEYTSRIKYLTSEAQLDFRLKIADGDTIPCAFYHFERTYNATPYNTFLIGFDQETIIDKNFVLDKNIELIYEDRTFGVEKITFEFDKEKIKKYTLVNIYTL